MLEFFSSFQFWKQNQRIKTWFIYESRPADLTLRLDGVAFSILRVDMFSQSLIRMNVSEDFGNIFCLKPDILFGINIWNQFNFKLIIREFFFYHCHYYSIYNLLLNSFGFNSQKQRMFLAIMAKRQYTLNEPFYHILYQNHSFLITFK